MLVVLQGSVQVTVCGSVVATKGVGDELGELGLLGGTGLAWSADVETLPVCDLALTLALALALTLTLTLTPTLALTLTLTLTLTRPASWLCSGAPTTCAWWLRSRRRPYPYPYPYPYPHPHPYP